MLRITKLSDYGVVLLTFFAGREGGGPLTARDLAGKVGLPLPTVSKILKALARGGLLRSQRGAKGGYALRRPPEEISVAQIIGALEGPIAITECVASAPGACGQESLCNVRANWERINEAVSGTLDEITLAEMIRPTPDFERRLARADSEAHRAGPAGRPGAEDEDFPVLPSGGTEGRGSRA